MQWYLMNTFFVTGVLSTVITLNLIFVNFVITEV
jgi:hypothetical protein